MERGILSTAEKHNTALARITLFDFILATVGHKNCLPNQSIQFCVAISQLLGVTL